MVGLMRLATDCSTICQTNWSIMQFIYSSLKTRMRLLVYILLINRPNSKKIRTFDSRQSHRFCQCAREHQPWHSKLCLNNMKMFQFACAKANYINELHQIYKYIYKAHLCVTLGLYRHRRTTWCLLFKCDSLFAGEMLSIWINQISQYTPS